MWKWQYIEHIRHNPNDATCNALQSPLARRRLAPHAFTEKLYTRRDINHWGYIL